MGRPKAWLPLGSETLLQRTARLFAPHVGRVIVSAAPEQPLPRLPDAIEVVRDAAPGGGPLHGLAAALARLSQHPRPPAPVEWFYWTGCDYPWTSSELLHLLHQTLHADETRDAVVPEVDGHLQPLCAIYRPRIATPLAVFLEEGGARVLEFLERLRLRSLSGEECRAAGVPPTAFHNLNTPEAYAAALFRLSSGPP